MDKIEVLSRSENPQILCISESWCSSLNLHTVSIPEYNIASFYVRQSHIHGGVIIYIKNDIGFKNLKYINDFSEEMHAEFCAVSFCINHVKYCLITIYRPPGGLIDVFINRMSQILNLCTKQFDNIMLCGDINVNYLVDSQAKKLLCDLLDSYGLEFKNMESTRIYCNKNGFTSSAKIDYFLTNIPQELYEECVKNLNVADHLALIITLNINYKRSCNRFSQNIVYRNISENNVRQLQFFLNNETFQTVYQCINDINIAFNAFIDILYYALDLYCPTQSKTLIQYSTKSWLTSDIINMGNKLKNVFWLKNNTGDLDFDIYYRKLKKEYNIKISTTKKLFYLHKLQNKNPIQKQKYMWNLVREKTGKIKDHKPIKLRINNQVVEKTDDLTNSFVNHFSTAPKLAIQNHFGNHTSTECTLTELNTPNTFFFHDVEVNHVVTVIRNLKNTNSMGIDCISTKIIKNVCLQIALPLTYIINLSVELGVFPDKLKIGVVTPIFKKYDPLVIDNYRGITVPTALSKVVEKVVYDKILLYLNKYNIISKCQNGFCPSKSTESATYDFVEYIYKNLDSNKFVGALFFDLSMAFDCLDLIFIREKLFAVGFRGNFLSWLMSYLQYRKIYVKLNNVLSNIQAMDLGVPQGSVLGPLIFLMFINDLPSHVSTDCTVLYADDVTLAAVADSPEELQVRLNILSDEFTNWCYKNSLIVNVEKTVCMQFCSRRKYHTSLHITVNNKTIPTLHSTKFLGVLIDSDMGWKSHIDYVCKKINSGYYALLQLKTMFDIKDILNIYYALIYCHLTYNVIIWGNASNFDVNRILVAQKKIIRLLFGIARTDSCKPYFKEHKILTFPCIYIYKCVLHTVKNISTFGRNSDTHNYQTRHGNLLRIPNHNTSLYEKTPSYMGIKFMNHLPVNIMEERNLNTLKNKLKMYLINKCFYSISEFISSND